MTLSLDTLCETLAQSFHNANVLLASMPPPVRVNHVTPQDNASPNSAEELCYRLCENQDGALRNIPTALFHKEQQYALQALSFSIRCHKVKKKTGPRSAQAALILHAPSFWYRLRHPHSLFELKIDIVDGKASIKIRCDLSRRKNAGKSKLNWVLLLTPEQEEKIEKFELRQPRVRPMRAIADFFARLWRAS